MEVSKEDKKKTLKKPWPTEKAMTQIYDLNLWGKDTSKFYSGFGSHNPEIVTPYIEVVKEFLTSFDKQIIICDLGCGDFNIGKQLVEFTKKYIAIDIVPDLINHNKEKFQRENLEFQCLDIAKDELPKGDCALVRQVLQHLSNAEVQIIVAKLSKYHYIILTEHLPNGEFEPNKDIISGQGIRIKKQSGIDLLKAPFNFQVIERKNLLSVHLNDGKGMISTTLYRTF